jgi:hypothetical protein
MRPDQHQLISRRLAGIKFEHRAHEEIADGERVLLGIFRDEAQQASQRFLLAQRVGQAKLGMNNFAQIQQRVIAPDQGADEEQA